MAVLVDIAIKWDVWKRQELYDFLLYRGMSRIQLSDRGDYIVFEDEKHIYYDDDAKKQEEYLTELLVDLFQNDFVKAEDIVNCLREESCWLSEVMVEPLAESFEHDNVLKAISTKLDNNQSISAKDLDQAVNNNNAEMEINSQTKGGQR